MIRVSLVAFLASLLMPSVPAARAAFDVCWLDARSAAMARSVLPAPRTLALGRSPVVHAGGTGGARWRFALSTGELYGLPDVGGARAEATLFLDDAAASLEFGALGSDLYRERIASLSLERRLVPDMCAAVRVAAAGISASGVDDVWTATLDVWVYRRFLGRVLVGGRYDNVTQSAIGGSPVPARARHGLTLALDGAMIGVLVESEPGFDTSSAVGIEAEASAWLRVRAGATIEPGTFSAGLGVGREASGRGLGLPVVDLAWNWHPVLGASYFVSVSFRT